MRASEQTNLRRPTAAPPSFTFTSPFLSGRRRPIFSIFLDFIRRPHGRRLPDANAAAICLARWPAPTATECLCKLNPDALLGAISPRECSISVARHHTRLRVPVPGRCRHPFLRVVEGRRTNVGKPRHTPPVDRTLQGTIPLHPNVDAIPYPALNPSNTNNSTLALPARVRAPPHFSPCRPSNPCCQASWRRTTSRMRTTTTITTTTPTKTRRSKNKEAPSTRPRPPLLFHPPPRGEDRSPSRRP